MKTPTKKYVTNIADQVKELKEVLADVYAICRRIAEVDSVMSMLYTHHNAEMDSEAGCTPTGNRAFVMDIFNAHGLEYLGDGAYRATGGFKDLVFKADGGNDDNDTEFRQYKNMLKTNIKYLAIPLLGKMRVKHETILIYPKADIGNSGKGRDNTWRFDELESHFCDMHSGNYGTYMGMVFATDFGGHDGNDFKGQNVTIPQAKLEKFDKVLAPIFELQKKTLVA